MDDSGANTQEGKLEVIPRKPREFRGLGTKPLEDRLGVVRVRFSIDQDLPLKIFTLAHPTVQCAITAIQRWGERQYVLEVEIFSQDPEDYTDELSRLPGVVSVSRPASIGPRTLYHGTIDLTPEYMRVVSELGALLRYPRLVENGRHTLEVVARTSQIRDLIERLGRIAHDVEVLRFGRGPMRSCPARLSPRQVALLYRALAAGYFDVPRRITLTSLATKLGRRKSGLSRALAVIERDLVEASAATSA